MSDFQKSKILLVNFTSAVSEELEKLGIIVHRGCLTHSEYFFPCSIYEYNAVFMRLENSDKFKEEFAEKLERFGTNEESLFYKYALLPNTFLTIFLSDWRDTLFIKGIDLEIAREKDTSIISENYEGESEIERELKNLKSEVQIPLYKYLKISSDVKKNYSNKSYRFNTVYSNKNNDVLGVYCQANQNPAFLVLPEYKDYKKCLKVLLKSIAKTSKNLLQELIKGDWIEDRKMYFPEEISTYDKEIVEIVQKAQKDIQETEEKRNKAIDQYKFVKAILYEDSTNLSKAVQQLLQTIFLLKAEGSDSDEDREEKGEDLVIEYNKKKYFAEVKGTRATSPTPQYFTQLWKHLRRFGTGDEIGILILNHDKEKNPLERKCAYISEADKKELQDIIFWDTRVLHSLALAVIDYDMKPEEACEKLFKLGRAEFDLEAYKKEKSKS